MARGLFTFSIYYIGAVTRWILHGCKGKIDSYLPRPNDRSNSGTKTFVIGSTIIFLLLFVGVKIYQSYQSTQPILIPGLTPEETDEVLELRNEKGEIVLTPEQIDKILQRLDSAQHDTIK